MGWDGGNRLWMRWDGWIDDACWDKRKVNVN